MIRQVGLFTSVFGEIVQTPILPRPAYFTALESARLKIAEAELPHIPSVS
jgi:hypothetical protein